jgi:anti-sigma regulatory factor (Ser/Thr protein kinase)
MPPPYGSPGRHGGTVPCAVCTPAFRHAALFYAGERDFTDSAAAFIREGIAEGEPVLVAVPGAKIALLRRALGSGVDGVRFADMAELGENPARIIPAWREFLDGHEGPVRGIGEPTWAGRSDAELAECHRHESLLNLAFADAGGFRLLCPYDVASLPADVVAAARHTHPVVVDEGANGDYDGLAAFTAPFSEPLAAPPAEAAELAFGDAGLSVLRRFVAARAAAAGVDGVRQQDLLLAVTEVAGNSLRHGGGGGVLRVWTEPDALVCEIRDAGVIDKPLAGRERPAPGQLGGYGLWLVNQLCELVQLRTMPEGNVVRLHKRR